MLRKALLLAASVAVSTILPAHADDVGIYFRTPSSILNPVSNKTATFDPADGALKLYTGTTWENKTLAKPNLSATTAPTINDDSGDGYGIGSFWYDSVGNQLYVCVSASVGAASWQLVTSGTVSPTDLANGLKFKLNTADVFSDFKVSGFASSDPGASLAMTTPLGIAYVDGVRIAFTAFSHTYIASKDTYDYLQSDGTVNHIAVNNGASAPSGQPGLLLQKVVTDGSEITSVTALAVSSPTFTVGTASLDGDALSLGQANTLYAPISLTTSKTQAYVYAVSESADDVPNFRLLTNGHLPVVDLSHGGLGASITANTNGVFVCNGTTGALSSAPGAGNSFFMTNSGNTGHTWMTKTDLIAEAVAAAVDEIGEGGGGGGGSADESFFGGGATDGAQIIGTNSFTHPIIRDFTTLEIETGNTVDVASGTVFNATETITITGTLNVSKAAAGGTGTDHVSSTEQGAGINGGRVSRVVDVTAGGGGGGCGGKGGNGGSDTASTVGGLGGHAFAEGDVLTLRGLHGSGGAAGEAGSGEGGSGGDGGGFLCLNAKGAILVDGTIDISGADGVDGDTQAGGGGGGSGGIAEIYSQSSINITGTVDLSGGDGGDGPNAADGGGGGGGGGILVLFSPSNSYGGGTVTLTGGSAGANGTQTATAGGDGFILDIQDVPNEPLQLNRHWGGGAFLLDEARKERIATGSNVVRWDAKKFRALYKKALTMR